MPETFKVLKYDKKSIIFPSMYGNASFLITLTLEDFSIKLLSIKYQFETNYGNKILINNTIYQINKNIIEYQSLSSKQYFFSYFNITLNPQHFETFGIINF